MLLYFLIAVAVCGTLDIGYAAVSTILQHGSIGGMLRSVASGPFGQQVATWGIAGPLAGLVVHFAIMAVMVLVFGLIVRRSPVGRISPWISGTLYGVALYLVMYWIVLPTRWPNLPASTDPLVLASVLFPHIALVGIPMALIARRFLKKDMIHDQ